MSIDASWRHLKASLVGGASGPLALGRTQPGRSPPASRPQLSGPAPTFRTHSGIGVMVGRMLETLEVAAFKHVVVPLGVVIGLGVARMMSSISDYLQHRDRVRFSVGHGLWCVILFLWFVGLWWIAWGLRLVDVSLWSFFTLIFLLMGPCLLYLAGSLVLPEMPEEGSLDLGDRLSENGRAFLLALAGVLVWLTVSEIWLLQEPWDLLPKRAFQLTSIAILSGGSFFPSRRVLTILAAVEFPIILTALGTVRSSLG